MSYKTLLLIVLSAIACSAVPECLKCYDAALDDLLNKQIKTELNAQLTYLTLAQKFDSYDNYYPKIAEFLRAKAAEELTHAERFIEYQNQRGGNPVIESVAVYTDGHCASVHTITEAFKCALQLERFVTGELTELQNNVQKVTKKTGCTDTYNDDMELAYSQPILIVSGDETSVLSTDTSCSDIFNVKLNYVELAEMIVHEFLGHQVKDLKELANLFKTIERMSSKSSTKGIANYLFDKHLEL